MTDMRTRICCLMIAIIAIGTASHPRPACAGPVFTGLGMLGQHPPYSAAAGLSENGRFVVGMTSSEDGLQAFRWDVDTGMIRLGDPPDALIGTFASAVSSSGNVVAGHGWDNTITSYAFRWTPEGGMVSVSDPARGFVAQGVRAVNQDGTVLVGTGVFAGDGVSVPYRWTPDTGATRLGELNGEISGYGGDVSSDGSVVVGTIGSEAFRWTAESGVVGLGVLPGASWSDA